MHARHVLGATAIAAAGLLALAGPAAGHINPSVTSAPAGSSLKFELRVGHGCGESGNTTKLEVQIPESITSVTPQVVPGWTIDTTIVQLEEPITGSHGEGITERTSLVTWTGGPLDHHQLEEFGLSVRLPDTPGETIHFPTIQSCDDGTSNEWIQIAEEGAEEPDSPAPAIALTAATDDGHGEDGDAGDAEEHAEEDEPSTVGTEVAAEDDGGEGGDGLALAGLIAGALGLIAGGTALLRSRTAG